MPKLDLETAQSSLYQNEQNTANETQRQAPIKIKPMPKFAAGFNIKKMEENMKRKQALMNTVVMDNAGISGLIFQQLPVNNQIRIHKEIDRLNQDIRQRNEKKK